MSIRRILATAQRLLLQMRYDRRTVALLFVVPPALIAMMKFVFQGNGQLFNGLAPILLGIFPMTMMFLVTSISMLRERTTGTLDRLMTMPITKVDLIIGYGVAFSCVALVQAVLSSAVMLGLLGVTVQGGTLATLVGAICAAFLGTSLGIFTSAFARTEFQAVQFMPAFIFPQLLTCGLFVAREHMAIGLRWFSDVMPLTYSVRAMQHITGNAAWDRALTTDLLIVLGCAVVALLAGSITIRRQD